MVGCVLFKKLQLVLEFGYWLGRFFWGKGYMSEVVQVVICWFFENISYLVLVGEVMVDNLVFLKVMEKIGFWVVGEVGCVSVFCGIMVLVICVELC